MSQKRFIVRRIGGEYQVEPDQLTSLGLEDACTAGVGAAMAGYGLFRRDLPGAILLLVGVVAGWQGLKGRRPGRKLWRFAARKLRLGASSGPSYPGDSGQVGQRPQDLVDEQSMESFPASDAPGR